MSRVAVPTGPALGIALALACPVFGQNSPPAYYWSAYPNPETTLVFTTGVAVDLSGNVYASLVGDHCVVKIPASGPVVALAGVSGTSGASDGVGSAARFNAPQGIAVDGSDSVYVAEYGNSTIRKISPAGAVTTLAGRAGVRGAIDGPGVIARFNNPRGIAVDGNRNLFVTDTANGRIRLVTADNFVRTIAGGTFGSRDAVGTIAQFNAPWGIALDRAGNLYVTDSAANTVRKLTGELRIVSTLAGTAGTTGTNDGVGAAARFNQPTGIAVDATGALFVTDTQNHTIRRIAPDGTVTTIGGRTDAPAGTDSGIGSAARFLSPYAVTVTNSGLLYVADFLGVRRGEPVRAPVITTQPTGLTVQAGAVVSLTVVATGAPPPTYQWWHDGALVAGATFATLTLNTTNPQLAGDYTVEVTSPIGSVPSSVATLVIHAPPTIDAAPRAATIGADGSAQLSVTASGTGPFSYQWLRDGTPVAGATGATLRTGDAGSYTVAVSNLYGTTTTAPVLIDFPGRLANLSTNAPIGPAGNPLIAGLVVAAPEGATKTLLVRAVGPALAQFGVTDALPQTVVSLFDARGALLARNSGWATNPLPTYNAIAAAATAVGAFALPPGSADSALLVDLPRGNYTVAVDAAGTTRGTGLVEVYALNEDSGRLANLSTRGQVGAGGGFVVGFVASGQASPNLLVRAVGPGLQPFGVAGALQRPVLAVLNGERAIATNAGWTTASNAAQIERAAAAVGAFPLARGAADSALLLTLLAGTNYTAQVTSADGTTGTVLIEIYQVF